MKILSFFKRIKKLASGIDGAINSNNRVNRSFLTTFSVDEDTLIGAYDAERVKLESRDLFRNGIGKACVDRFTNFVVGSGFNIQSKTKNKKWNTSAEAFFNNWTKVADYNKRRTWIEILQTIIRDRLLVGPSFFILTDNGQLQPIEASRIASPEPTRNFESRKIVQGIELKDGIIVAYYVCERGDYGQVDKTKYRRIKAKDMIFISATWRWDAIRSIAELSPILDTLRDKSEFTTSTLISAKLAARKSLLITSEGDMPTVLPARDGNSSSSSTGTIETRTKMVKTADGEITYGAPGDKIEVPKQEIPATTYPAFTKAILTEVAAILGISYEILMMQLQKVDPVALRVASQVFKIYQMWLSEKFIERVWNWRISKAIKAGDLPPAPLDSAGVSQFYMINVIPPADPFVTNQVAQDIQGFNLGTVSITQIAKRVSKDNVELLSEKVDDISVAIELAEGLNKKHKTNITWRDIINSTGPASLSSVQTAADQDNLNGKEEKEEKEEEEEKEEKEDE